MKNWYLIKTKPRKEKIAIQNLKNQLYKQQKQRFFIRKIQYT